MKVKLTPLGQSLTPVRRERSTPGMTDAAIDETALPKRPFLFTAKQPEAASCCCAKGNDRNEESQKRHQPVGRMAYGYRQVTNTAIPIRFTATAAHDKPVFIGGS